jgi:hypothetical protein
MLEGFVEERGVGAGDVAGIWWWVRRRASSATDPAQGGGRVKSCPSGLEYGGVVCGRRSAGIAPFALEGAMPGITLGCRSCGQVAATLGQVEPEKEHYP